MRKIDIPAMGDGAQIWFNIGRLKKAEALLKKPISRIVREMEELNITSIILLLQAGMAQLGNKPESYFEQAMDKAFDSGYSMEDFQVPVLKALLGSDFMGKAAYAQYFPEDLTEEELEEAKAELKN